MGKAGITLPEKLNLAGIFSIAAQVTSQDDIIAEKTARGIGIGKSEKDVFSSYGKIKKHGNIINYELGRRDTEGVNFKVIDGKVTGIKLYYGINPLFTKNNEPIEEVIDVVIAANLLNDSEPGSGSKSNSGKRNT